MSDEPDKPDETPETAKSSKAAKTSRRAKTSKPSRAAKSSRPAKTSKASGAAKIRKASKAKSTKVTEAAEAIETADTIVPVETAQEEVALADFTEITAPIETSDTIVQVETAREEVALTEPEKAPLADAIPPEERFSPVDLPAPDQPLPGPLKWTFQVIATAALFLALFNADAIRGWSYELKPTPTTQRVVGAAETWFDATALVGLDLPLATMRGWWRTFQAKKFDDRPQQTGPSAEAPEPGSLPDS